MNPKAKPILLVIVLTVLVVAALRGQHKCSHSTEQETIPNITVMLNFNSVAQ